MSVVLARTPQRSLVGRAWAGLAAVWGVVLGVLPHVLHHVGPLAGAAFLAGAGGTTLFAVVGFVFTIPLLIRLRRRFNSWIAPAVALALFAAMFTFSTLVIAPAISGSDSGSTPSPGIEQPAGHASHHTK